MGLIANNALKLNETNPILCMKGIPIRCEISLPNFPVRNLLGFKLRKKSFEGITQKAWRGDFVIFSYRPLSAST